jgi:ribosomal protein S18 acetylase RimI-like enzyme
MSIRPATPDDVDAVVSLEQQLFGTDAWSRPSVVEELTGPRRRAVVGCAPDGSVIGYAVTVRSDDVLDLQRIAVAPASRRTGVARALLADVRRVGREDGAHRMLLEVSAANEAAVSFYAAEGLVPVDRRPRYYRDGTDALVLGGPLDAREVAP